MASVLVVDDRAVNRKLLVTLLAYQGHRMWEAEDGAQALTVVRANRPDLVICDVLMPTMDGYEFVRQLRADFEIAQTQVIFYTAHYHQREASNLAKACGVSHVLTKPAEPHVIVALVEQLLGQTAAPPPLPTAEPFDRDHLRLLTDKLSQKADDLRFANDRLAALSDLNLQLASERSSIQLLELAVAGARELLGARYGILAIKQQTGDEMPAFLTSGIPAELVTQLGGLALDQGVLGTVLTQRRATRLHKPESVDGALGLPMRYPPVQSLLAAPVASSARVYGWVCLTDKLGAKQFSDEDERLLTILGAQVGGIYENGTLYAALQAHADTLQQEIIERKRAQTAMRQSEIRFRQLAENIRDVFFLIDLDSSRLHYVSPAYEEIWGRSCESLYAEPHSWADSIHPDDHANALASFVEGMTTGFDHEYRIVRPDGAVRWIRSRGFSVLDEAGKSYRTAGVASDVTESKRGAEELRESERRFSDMLRNLELVSLMLDPRRADHLLQRLPAAADGLAARGGDWPGLVRALPAARAS